MGGELGGIANAVSVLPQSHFRSFSNYHINLHWYLPQVLYQDHQEHGKVIAFDLSRQATSFGGC